MPFPEMILCVVMFGSPVKFRIPAHTEHAQDNNVAQKTSYEKKSVYTEKMEKSSHRRLWEYTINVTNKSHHNSDGLQELRLDWAVQYSLMFERCWLVTF